MIKKIFLGLALVLIALQLVRPSKNIGNAQSPNDISRVVAVPPNIEHLLRTSCYDCHSNTTRYPWYAHVMPVGWWLNHHVEEGKEHLNFSEFATYPQEKQDHKLDETAEEVEEHEMPLKSYTTLHPEAAISEAQIAELKEWITRARREIGNR